MSCCAGESAEPPAPPAPIAVAEDEGPDVLHMPTDDRRGLGRALHASATAQVLADAPCVVMTIPAAS